MTDAVYELVRRHVSRATAGSSPALTLVINDRLPQDLVIMTKLDIQMCKADYWDFRQRLQQEQRFDDLTTT